VREDRILNGYYFTATGVSEYAFFDGELCVLRVVHSGLFGGPVFIQAGDREWSFIRNSNPADVCHAFTDAEGNETGWLYHWDAAHFAVSVPGAALTGRINRSHLRRSILYTGLDEEVVALLGYSVDHSLSRERFGEWFPRRYVATVWGDIDSCMPALAAPFLWLGGIEVGAAQ